MKVKMIKGNHLAKVENLVNRFCESVKVEDIKIAINGDIYVVMVIYYELL